MTEREAVIVRDLCRRIEAECARMAPPQLKQAMDRLGDVARSFRLEFPTPPRRGRWFRLWWSVRLWWAFLGKE